MNSRSVRQLEEAQSFIMSDVRSLHVAQRPILYHSASSSPPSHNPGSRPSAADSGNLTWSQFHSLFNSGCEARPDIFGRVFLLWPRSLSAYV
jgi:hypothetical protein